MFNIFNCFKIHRTTILPVVFYGCETWSLKWMEEHRLRVCDNKLLRIIFRPKQNVVRGVRRKLHNGELKDPYSSTNIIRIIKSRRWAGQILGRE